MKKILFVLTSHDTLWDLAEDQHSIGLIEDFYKNN